MKYGKNLNLSDTVIRQIALLIIDESDAIDSPLHYDI